MDIRQLKYKLLARSRQLRPVMPALAVAVMAGGLGMYAMGSSDAATYAANREAEAGQIAGNAEPINGQTGASGSAAVRFGSAPTTPTPTPPPPATGCALPNYPTPACTGVPSGTVLTTHNGDLEVRTAGQVVQNLRVTGTIFVYANNVTIRNSEAHAGISNGFGSSTPAFTVVDSTIGPPTGCGKASGAGFSIGYGIGESNYTASRVHIRNVSDGIRDSGSNILVEDSFVRLCSTSPEDHSDGFQAYLGGTNVVLRHNTIDQRPVPNESQTAPIFVADGSKDAHLFDNLLAGGTFTIRVYNGGGSYRVTGNRIVQNAWQFGPVDASCGVISWSDNRLVTIDSSYQVTALGAVQPCVGN